MDAESEFMDSWSNALQVAADAYRESVEQIVETFSESVSGIYKNLEELQEAFDRTKEKDERYLATYEKTY
jgi:endonuclease IV